MVETRRTRNGKKLIKFIFLNWTKWFAASVNYLWRSRFLRNWSAFSAFERDSLQIFADWFQPLINAVLCVVVASTPFVRNNSEFSFSHSTRLDLCVSFSIQHLFLWLVASVCVCVCATTMEGKKDSWRTQITKRSDCKKSISRMCVRLIRKMHTHNTHSEWIRTVRLWRLHVRYENAFFCLAIIPAHIFSSLSHAQFETSTMTVESLLHEVFFCTNVCFEILEGYQFSQRVLFPSNGSRDASTSNDIRSIRQKNEW